MGTGGWAYFPVESGSRLQAYSRAFNFVEVNSTFYEYPDPEQLELWRRTVPSSFTFSVRCHQDLTHRIGLKPISEAYQVLNQMINYCNILRAPFLVFETPATYTLTDQVVEDAQAFFSSSNLRGVRLIWENRAPMTSKAQSMMQNSNIVHSVDLSRQEPLFASDVLYTRLFGKGKHNIYQFSDEELEEIAHKVLNSKAKTVALSYHGVRMNTDALRFNSYLATGSFPSITRLTGVAAAKAALAEDAKFPASRQALVEDQGWKIFDATSGKRLRLSEWLVQIPDKVYDSVDDVVEALGENQ
ncbi:MAG TPA: DUF72 domain-containing protein [Candidatus Nanoarchaeia archaeon]|nr:DUF72 domain-containing protein [Candidatus Nanoarchaeia archaeon]